MNEVSLDIPYWLDDEQWKENPLDGDIMQNMHLDESLKPTSKEWKIYFHWLVNVVGYPVTEVKLIKSMKSRQRRITVRLCMFLHFHRAGIPTELIVKGEFGTPAYWRKAQRKAWRNASFLYAPRVNKKVDWWCSPDPEPSLTQCKKAKICHRLQTSVAGVDEQEDRNQMLNVYIAFATKVTEAQEKANKLLLELQIYDKRYATEPYNEQIQQEKQKSLAALSVELQNALNVVQNEKSLENLEKIFNFTFSASLQCYEVAHVLYAEEKLKSEEIEKVLEQERQREKEEEQKKEESAKKSVSASPEPVKDSLKPVVRLANKREDAMKKEEDKEKEGNEDCKLPEVVAAAVETKPKLKEESRHDVTWGGSYPFWLDEKKWEENPLDTNIVDHIHDQDVLKPSKDEWEDYFFWLEKIIEYPLMEIEMMRKMKLWQRHMSIRLCLFLHFRRAGIPLSRIIPGSFGSVGTWKHPQRIPWKKAAYVRVPMLNNSVDWWCTDIAEPETYQQSQAKICHKLQTSVDGIDEQEDRLVLSSLIISLGQSIDEIREESALLITDAATYEERYSVPRFQRLVNKQKQQEIAQLINDLETSLEIVEDEKMLCKVEKNYGLLYAACLQSYQSAHVAFAAEKSKVEEGEREKVRAAKEKLEREEKERFDNEMKEQKEKEKAEQRVKRKEQYKAKKESEKAEKVNRVAAICLGNDEEDGKPIHEKKEELVEPQELEEEKEVVVVPLTKFEIEREAMKAIIESPPSNVGELVFNVFDTIERFTAERILLIGKQLKMNEEELVNILQVNQKLADSNRRKIKRSQKTKEKREHLADSLEASGLL